MRDITKLDPSKITKNGCYFEERNIFWLTNEEILKCREYFNDNNIAYEKKILTQEQLRRRRKLQLQREQAYRKAKIKLAGGILIIVAGISIIVFPKCFKAHEETKVETVYGGEVEIVYSPNNTATYGHMTFDEDVHVVNLNNNTSSNNEDIETHPIVNEQKVVSEEDIRQQLVHKYCDVYQINYDVVYPRLVKLTDNFTSKDYLDGIIDGVTCKGEQACGRSEEETILYFCRCAKQVPARLGIDKSNLYINNGYKSLNSYGEDISYYASLLDEDAALVYSIVQAETSFESELFIDCNNPAGIRFGNNGFARFSTKEEGFIEFILELKKYRRMGASTIEEIRDIHAPLSDGNDEWLPNVLEIYSLVSANPSDYLGSTNESKLKI